MTETRPTEPPFDPRWLDTLADVCRNLTATTPQIVDLFLERSLELRVTTVGRHLQAEESRSEGSAVRWRFPSRTTLHARTGTSPAALDDLMSHHPRGVTVPRSRPIHPVEIDPPRGWRDWAATTIRQAPSGNHRIRFLARRGVVIRPGQWIAVESPPLVRVELDGNAPSALLAVWGHPLLADWLAQLFESPPDRRWRPGSGLQVPVLFRSGTAGVLLHEAVGHLVESDLVVSQSSPLAAQLGASVTAASITVTDDPTRWDLPGSFSSDDEGEPAAERQLVDRGRLVGWLSDRAGSLSLGTPGGRGRRASWDRPPIARLSNLIIAAGHNPPESLEQGLDQGLVVERLGGATVDPVSSRLVLRVERGWEIHNGRRRRPTQSFELTGSVLDVLAHIDPDLGADRCPDWRLGWCVKDGVPLATGSEAPTMLIHALEVL